MNYMYRSYTTKKWILFSQYITNEYAEKSLNDNEKYLIVHTRILISMCGLFIAWERGCLNSL